MRAVHAFAAQTYPLKELIILDDEDNPSFTMLIFKDVTYLTEAKQKTIGWKRNKLADSARGEILCHWDSDDWSAPSRLAVQMKVMEDTGKAVCGFTTMLFVDEDKKKVWRYRAPDRVIGSSLLYTRKFWQGHQFPNQQIEESEFINAAIASGQMSRALGHDLMVARIHKENTVQKQPLNSPETYTPVDWTQVPLEFFQEY
jgi:glycosyltransferase involved in cell wall biosynthesis